MHFPQAPKLRLRVAQVRRPNRGGSQYSAHAANIGQGCPMLPMEQMPGRFNPPPGQNYFIERDSSAESREGKKVWKSSTVFLASRLHSLAVVVFVVSGSFAKNGLASVKV